MDNLCDKPVPEEVTDGELVGQAAAGDLGAFEGLISKYQRAVFSIALYKSKNYFDAEDLTQEIFLSAFKALPTLKAPGNFSSWLFGIAYNRCHKWFRRERTKILKFAEIKKRVAEDERRRCRDSRSGTRAKENDSEHLSDQILRLPADIRQVLTMKFLEGLSYQEIENCLHINSNRIDYLIRKGKQLLRSRLERNAVGSKRDR